MGRQCRIRCADRTDRLSLCYPGALRHSHAGERAVDGVVSAAVLKDDRVAVRAHHVGEDHLPGGNGADLCSFRGGYTDSVPAGCRVVRIDHAAKAIDDVPVHRPVETTVITRSNRAWSGGRTACARCRTSTCRLEARNDGVESRLAFCELCQTRSSLLRIVLDFRQAPHARRLERGQTRRFLRLVGTVLLDTVLKGDELPPLPDDRLPELIDTAENCAVALGNDVEVLVTRDEIRERFSGEHHFERIEWPALVDLHQAPAAYRTLDLNFVLSPDEVGRRVLHLAVQHRQLLVQRSHNAHCGVVLAVQIVHFLGDIVSLGLQPAHTLLQGFALALDSRQLRLLLPELRVTVVLRSGLYRQNSCERYHQSQCARHNLLKCLHTEVALPATPISAPLRIPTATRRLSKKTSRRNRVSTSL